MGKFAGIEGGIVANVIIAEPLDIGNLPGEWVDVTNEAAVGMGWGYSGGVFTEPAPAPPVTRYLLTGAEWVSTFTDTEWAWLKTQRLLTTATGKQLDKFMDAIRWSDSINVESANVDPFYSWMLNNGIPGGQTRIDELRAGVTE